MQLICHGETQAWTYNLLINYNKLYQYLMRTGLKRGELWFRAK